MRRKYDKVYRSIALNAKIRRGRIASWKRRIADYEASLRILKQKREEWEYKLRYTREDLVRLSADVDRLKGEKERLAREIAAEKRQCSLMPMEVARIVRMTRQHELQLAWNRVDKDLEIKEGQSRAKQGDIEASIPGAMSRLDRRILDVADDLRSMTMAVSHEEDMS